MDVTRSAGAWEFEEVTKSVTSRIYNANATEAIICKNRFDTLANVDHSLIVYDPRADGHPDIV